MSQISAHIEIRYADAVSRERLDPVLSALIDPGIGFWEDAMDNGVHAFRWDFFSDDMDELVQTLFAALEHLDQRDTTPCSTDITLDWGIDYVNSGESDFGRIVKTGSEYHAWTLAGCQYLQFSDADELAEYLEDDDSAEIDDLIVEFDENNTYWFVDSNDTPIRVADDAPFLDEDRVPFAVSPTTILDSEQIAAIDEALK